MRSPELDIVIPVYNEAENIVPVLDSLRVAVQTSFRVQVCYDRDDDTTLPPVRNYPRTHFEIALTKNMGRGVHAAVLTGFRKSVGKAVLVFPADDTNNAAIIDRMYIKHLEGCDIVAASRFMKGGSMERCPWFKALLVRFVAFSLYRIARIPTRDATNGFRLFSKRVLENIQIESTEGFTYSIELLVKCHRLGWKIGEVPALWQERTAGKSRFKVLRWLPHYLKWYFYAFKTTCLGLRKKPEEWKVNRTGTTA